MKTIDVFGVSNSNIASYIERDDVDARFVEGLQRDKHIVVFGSSKQGKTALTNKHLTEEQFIRINCSPETSPIDIYKSVLRQLNVEFEEEKTSKISEEGSGKLGVKAQVKIPLVTDLQVGGDIGRKEKEEKQVKYKPVEYNLCLPQDVSENIKISWLFPKNHIGKLPLFR